MMTKEAEPAAASGRQIDWEAVQRDFRAGVLSLREIGVAHGLTHTAVAKRAKRDGWARDLKARIQARADELVQAREAAPRMSAGTEREVIEANAERIAQVRSEHRQDINRVRSLGLALLSELEAQSAHLEDFERLGELMAAPDERGVDRMRDVYQRVISTPGRVDSAKKVAETLKQAIGLEREAYGLDDETNGRAESVFETLLDLAAAR